MLEHLEPVLKTLDQGPKGLSAEFLSPSRNEKFGNLAAGCTPNLETFPLLRHRIDVRDGKMHLEIYGPKPTEERFETWLDAEGRKLNADGSAETPFFVPVIKVDGNAKGQVLVDLRGLYFIDAFEVWLPPAILYDDVFNLKMGGQTLMNYKNFLPKEWLDKLDAPNLNAAMNVAHNEYLSGPILRMRFSRSEQVVETQFGWTRMGCTK